MPLSVRPYFRLTLAFIPCSAFLLLAPACGTTSCPEGSVSIDGNCVSQDACPGDRNGDGGCAIRIAEDAGADASVERDASQVRSACDALDCGDHGRCVERGEDTAACDCDEGFVGDHCGECEAGLVLTNDGERCVSPCEHDDAPSCGSHGECVEEDGEASCECEPPYAGDTCSDCAEGFSADDEGVCMPDCGDCGAHAYCDGTLLIPACACNPGYVREGVTCAWKGEGQDGIGVLDGNLEEPSAWVAQHVSIANGRATYVNQGSGNSCELGTLSQTFLMPSRAESEQLVLDISASTNCGAPADCPGLQVEFGQSVTRIAISGNTSSTTSVCLGSAAYGGEVKLTLRPNLVKSGTVPQAFSCDTDEWPVLERIALRPADTGECPAEGDIQNSELTSSAGWTLSSATVAGGQLQLEVNGSASVSVNVPDAAVLPSAALRVKGSGAFGHVGVALDGLRWATVVWNETGRSFFLCLPPWARGAVHRMTLTGRQNSGVSAIDSVALETDSSCGDGALDTGFERAPLDMFVANYGSWEYGSGSPIVGTQAQSGTRGLQLGSNSNHVRTLARIPESELSSFPAFSYWYRVVGSITSSSATIHPLSGGASDALSSSTWLRNYTCLPRAWDGQLTELFVFVSFSGSGEVQLDNVGPVLDPACNREYL